MRILSGNYKGRKIYTASNVPYRPTQSRIRKSVFDILGNLEGKSFLDLYAGSGIMGFEAASRGAVQIDFVDIHSRVCQLLKRNIQLFEESHFNVTRKDALTYLSHQPQYDIIFSDPPYTYLEDTIFRDQLVQMSQNALKPNGTYVLEVGKDLSQFPAHRRKDFGDTTCLFWRKSE